MAINDNDFQKYKNRVQGQVNQDLYSDINFQNIELFKQNLRSQKVQQGLSYNNYQNDIRRQLNNAANGILQQSQNGLIGSSALRQMLANNQLAGQSIAQTANSYAQSQMQANQQLNKADIEEEQLKQQYTAQEATKAYQQDLQAGYDSEANTNRKNSAIFGGLGALGAILSFIPVTAPLGLALDVVSGAGMIGTDIAQEVNNPTKGNTAQLGIDTVLSGLSLIPGISAIRGLSKEATGLERGLEANQAAMKLEGAERNVNNDFNNFIQPINNRNIETFYGQNQKLLSYSPPGSLENPFIAGSTRIKPLGELKPNSVINRNYTNNFAKINNELNQANTTEKIEKTANNILSDNELKTIKKETEQELKQENKDIANNKAAFITKYKNKIWESIKGKSTYQRSQLAQERYTNSTNNLIGARRVLAGTLARGVGRGLFLGGTHYISNNILNSYLSGDNVLNSTQLTWRQIFDELNIPQNIRLQGL